jgi:hypothetical protein
MIRTLQVLCHDRQRERERNRERERVRERESVCVCACACACVCVWYAERVAEGEREGVCVSTKQRHGSRDRGMAYAENALHQQDGQLVVLV